MKIEFLGMKSGCPNTPKMWIALQQALRELKWDIPVDSLDLIKLSDRKDVRAGHGSPSILIDGKDLFDAPMPETYDPACRFYRGGVPGAKEIIAKLRSLSP